MQTLLLDNSTGDLVLDVNGNVAVASEPYSLAQDAASAIKTFLGECYLDTTLGVPWFQQIFGKAPTLSFMKQQLVTAALTVPDIASAQCFITNVSQRVVSGQVQVVSSSTGQTSAANFTIVSPQGTG